MHMGVAPAHHRLKNRVELGDGGIAAHQETPPNQGTDLEEYDAELIDVGHDRILRVWNFPKPMPSWCPGEGFSPRFLALSYRDKASARSPLP